MANLPYSVGLRNVGSYVVSGHPYITGSSALTTGGNSGHTGASSGEYRFQFPYVSQNVYVVNRSSSGQLYVHFNSASCAGGVITSTTKHYITLDPGASISLDVKCKEVYLTAITATQTFEMVADLTNIPTESMYTLTGSGLTG